MHRIIGRIMAVAGGVIAAVLFIILSGTNYTGVLFMRIGVTKAGAGIGGLLTGILAALIALGAAGVAVLSFRSLKLLSLENYIGATMALILASMLGSVGGSVLPFWIVVSILLIVGGANLAAAETVKIDLAKSEAETMTFTTADVVMLGASAGTAVFCLIGIFMALYFEGKYFYWRHLINTIPLLLICLANFSFAFLSVQVRGLLKTMRWLNLVVLALAVPSTYGLYAMNGLIVILAAVTASVSFYIEKEGQAFGINEVTGDGAQAEQV